jgi:hypothetical protein
LEGLGLLERRPHSTDRRVNELHLSAEGRALRKRLVKRLTVDSPMQGLDKEQQDLLRDLLQRATTTVPNAGRTTLIAAGTAVYGCAGFGPVGMTLSRSSRHTADGARRP